MPSSKVLFTNLRARMGYNLLEVADSFFTYPEVKYAESIYKTRLLEK